MNPFESSYRGSGAAPRGPFQACFNLQARHPATEAQVAPCSTSIFFRL